jgi:tetratricopeptide (TPR) repeat protein
MKRKLGPAHPDTLMGMNDMANTYLMAGRIDEAVALFEETLRLMSEHLGPAHLYTYHTTRELADSYWRAGRVEKAIETYEDAIKQKPDEFVVHVKFAEILTSREPSDNRRSRRALEAATTATELNPQAFVAWRLLGRAHYWAGDWDECIEAIEKSISLQPKGEGDYGLDWLFLAMAHARLGHNEEAKKLYDDATAWMDEHRPDDEHAAYLRTEAGRVLGISDPRKSTEPKHQASPKADIREPVAPPSSSDTPPDAAATPAVDDGVIVEQADIARP